MSVNKWLGGLADHETDANYTANWSTGSKPANGDTLVFDASAGDNATTGYKYNCVWTNFADGVLDLVGLIVDEGYTGNIADITTPLLANIEYTAGSPGKFVYEGSGTAHIELKVGTATKDTCGIVMMNATGSLYLYSFAAVNNWGDIFCVAGNLYLAVDTICDKIYSIGAGAVVTIGEGVYDGTDPTEIYQSAGVITSDSLIGTICRIYGGTFNWGSAANEGAINGASDAGTNLVAGLVEVYGSSIFNWRIEHTTATDKSIVNQFKTYNGGQFNVSSTVGAAGYKEIGTGTEISEVWHDSAVGLDNGMDNISISAGSKILTYGGILTPPENTELSW